MKLRQKLARTIAATAVFTAVSTHASATSTVYGKTLPPIGYVDVCARNAAECRSARPEQALRNTFELSSKRWSELKQINVFVNAHVAPISDLDQHDVPEHWSYPSGAGDCEDYVLLKKRYLEGLGFPAEALLITVVLDEAGEGHAVLTARTSAGDYILDNRRDTIMRWSETNYQFLKRQSQADPNIWKALTNKEARRATRIYSGGN